MLWWTAALAHASWPALWETRWQPDDLAAIASHIGDARLIGLGESIHTTGGQAEARVTRPHR